MTKFLIVLLLILGCETEIPTEQKEEDYLGQKCLSLIKIDNYFCFIDDSTNTILYPITNNSEINGLIEYSDNYYDNILINDSLILNNSIYNFGNITTNDTVNIKTVIEGEINNYELFFTTLPTVMFYTNQNIVDEPKIPSKILINDIISNNSYNFYSGIEIRGGTSEHWPKSSYDIELWEDENGLENKKEELFSLRDDDDWILDAMYLDLSKSRNIIGMQIWESFASANYTPIEEDFRLGQNGITIELFVNNEYLGIYSFNEPIDRKQLQLNQSSGILYKSEIRTPESSMEGIESEPIDYSAWNGFQLKYPEIFDETAWIPLKELIELVAYSEDQIFSDSIEELIDIDNAIDYFIFINIIQAFDNMAKNMFIMRYDQNHRLAFIPWDLDLSFGIAPSTDFGDWVTINSIMHNRLFDRLYNLDVNGYRNKVKVAWNEISSQLNLHTEIFNRFNERINSVIESKAHLRENKKWILNSDINDELNHINSWVNSRIILFEDYINNNY